MRPPGVPGRGMFIGFMLAMGLAAVAGIGGLVVGLCAAFGGANNPINVLLNDLTGIETEPVPGDPANFDPFGALPGVQRFAGDRTELVSIDVSLVRRDGTQDLDAEYRPSPRTTYEFVREVDRPKDAPPPGAGGANTGPWMETVTIEAYDPGQRRRLTETGGGGGRVVDYTNRGMERDTEDPRSGEVETVAPPACSIADFFEVAIEQGAPEDAVARVQYDKDGYEFSISGLGVNLKFGMDCALIE